jgi:hypothetical protein
MAAMHGVCARDQVAERRGKQGQHVATRPVVAWPVRLPIVIDVTLIDALLTDAIELNSILFDCVFAAIVRSDRGHGGTHMA